MSRALGFRVIFNHRPKFKEKSIAVTKIPNPNQEHSFAVKFLFNQERADKISVWGPNSQCPGMRLLKPGTGHQIFQGRIPGSSNEHLETDVLGSLEKLQTLGTMRSIRCVASASA